MRAFFRCTVAVSVVLAGCTNLEPSWADAHCRYQADCEGLDFTECREGVEEAEGRYGAIGCGEPFRTFYTCIGDSFTCADPAPDEWTYAYRGPCEGVWFEFFECYGWDQSYCSYYERCEGLERGECLTRVADAEQNYAAIGCDEQFRRFYLCIGESFTCASPAPGEWNPDYRGPCEVEWLAFYDCYSS